MPQPVKGGEHLALPVKISVRDGVGHAQRFELHSGAGQIDQILARYWGYRVAFLRLGDDEPGFAKTGQSLAHGPETESVACAQFVDFELHTRPQAAAQNV